MPEEVLFKSEQSMSREEVAQYLRTVADKLDGDGSLSLSAGDQSVTMDVPARPEFEVKAERETSRSGGPAELSVEFELEWDEGAESGGESDTGLSIE